MPSLEADRHANRQSWLIKIDKPMYGVRMQYSPCLKLGMVRML